MVLQGFFAKTWCNVWCFRGHFVVLCMVKMVVSSQLFDAEKTRQLLELYFVGDPLCPDLVLEEFIVDILLAYANLCI